jgi:hypothetical protein
LERQNHICLWSTVYALGAPSDNLQHPNASLASTPPPTLSLLALRRSPRHRNTPLLLPAFRSTPSPLPQSQMVSSPRHRTGGTGHRSGGSGASTGDGNDSGIPTTHHGGGGGDIFPQRIAALLLGSSASGQLCRMSCLARLIRSEAVSTGSNGPGEYREDEL